MPYIAFCSRTWLKSDLDYKTSVDGKEIKVYPDQILSRDGDALAVVFTSHDQTGKHEMLRSFIGQKVKITVEIED